MKIRGLVLGMMNGAGRSAETDANNLAEAVETAGELAPIYAWLEASLPELEASGYYSIEELLPAIDEPGIGFSFREKRDGKTLWQTIAAAAKDSICSPTSDVRKYFQTAKHISAGGLVSTVMITLGLPPAALPVAVAMAAVLGTIGIQGFCSWTSAEPDEPSET